MQEYVFWELAQPSRRFCCGGAKMNQAPAATVTSCLKKRANWAAATLGSTEDTGCGTRAQRLRCSLQLPVPSLPAVLSAASALGLVASGFGVQD